MVETLMPKKEQIISGWSFDNRKDKWDFSTGKVTLKGKGGPVPSVGKYIQVMIDSESGTIKYGRITKVTRHEKGGMDIDVQLVSESDLQ
jgi:hypothetical protein